MSRQNPECQFKRAVTDAYDGFFSRIEIGKGGDSGFPDLVLGTSSGLIPAELKIGKIEDGVLWCSNIRPAQLAFARKIANAGFPSIFMVGIQESAKWRCFVFNAILAPQFDSVGFVVSKDTFELDMNNLSDDLDEFVFREFGA